MERGFANFTLPGVDQGALNRMSQDLSGPMRIDPSAQVSRMSFEPGQAYAFRFTTSEYNVGGFHKQFNLAEAPGTNYGGGTVYISVSKCPGDFTSPTLTESLVFVRPDLLPIKGGCLSATGPVGGRIDFGFKQTACQLEENQVYYLNLTSGFESQLFDSVTYQGGTELGFFGYKTSTGGSSQPPIMAIKGLEETYRAIHSIYSEWNRNAYNSAQQLRSRIASCLASGQPRSSCNFELGAPAFPGQWR